MLHSGGNLEILNTDILSLFSILNMGGTTIRESFFENSCRSTIMCNNYLPAFSSNLSNEK